MNAQLQRLPSIIFVTLTVTGVFFPGDEAMITIVFIHCRPHFVLLLVVAWHEIEYSSFSFVVDDRVNSNAIWMSYYSVENPIESRARQIWWQIRSKAFLFGRKSNEVGCEINNLYSLNNFITEYLHQKMPDRDDDENGEWWCCCCIQSIYSFTIPCHSFVRTMLCTAKVGHWPGGFIAVTS